MARASRIDIVVAAHNRSDRLRPTVDAVLTQTVEDWTLLVVSDGSDDDTDDVVRSYADRRVQLLRVGPYGHPGAPRNHGVAAGRSPAVAYLDHDDRWRPDHLEVLLAHLEAGAEWVVTGCVRVDEHGVERDRTGLLDEIWHPELQVLNAMFEPTRVGHTRGLLDDLGGWSPGPDGFEDWDLWFRAARGGHAPTIVADRTAIQEISPTSRRSTMRPAHAVVVAQAPDKTTAQDARDLLIAPEVAAAGRAAFVDDTVDWYSALAGDEHYRAPSPATPERLRGELSRAARAPFERLGCLPGAEGTARLVLPLWCASPQHRRAIGDVLNRRFVRQHRHVHDVLDRASREPREASAPRTGRD